MYKEEPDQRGRGTIPSIKLLTNHQTCHKKFLEEQKIEKGKTNSGHTTNNVNDGMINNNPFIPDVPFHLDPLLRQPIKQNTTHE